MLQLSGEIDECKAKAEQALARCDAQLRAKDEECKSTLEGLRAKNRMLNERILELQGNIRVLCRIRPMSRRELDANTGGPSIEQLIQYPEEGMMYFHDQKYEFDNVSGGLPSRNRDNCMSMDSGFHVEGSLWHGISQVFRPDSEQMNIFKDVQSAVWSAVNGYRVSIFAYGQVRRHEQGPFLLLTIVRTPHTNTIIVLPNFNDRPVRVRPTLWRAHLKTVVST